MLKLPSSIQSSLLAVRFVSVPFPESQNRKVTEASVYLLLEEKTGRARGGWRWCEDVQRWGLRHEAAQRGTLSSFSKLPLLNLRQAGLGRTSWPPWVILFPFANTVLQWKCDSYSLIKSWAWQRQQGHKVLSITFVEEIKHGCTTSRNWYWKKIYVFSKGGWTTCRLPCCAFSFVCRHS